MRALLLTILFLICISAGFSQEIPAFEKTTYRDSLNRFHVQTSLPLYLYVSTTPNDKNPNELSQNNSDKQFNKVEPMYLDGNGEHTIKHFDTHCQKIVVFSIFADGTAPISQSTFFNSPMYIKNNHIIYGRNLQISLSTKDDMSGIKKLFYSVNGQNFQEYTQTIQANSEKENILKYFAVDNVGNIEKVIEKKFIIDITEPKTYYNVTGISKRDNQNIISTTSVIYLEPTDKISGVAKTYYKFDNEKEQIYDGRFVPFNHLTEGEHTLYFYSTDNVQNKETEQKFDFFLDKTAPIIATDVLGDRFIVNNQVYFSGRTKLKITAVDNKIGVKEVKYSVDNSEYKNYSDPFYLPSKAGIHVIRYFAVDSLENKTMENKDYENLVYRHNVSKVYVDLTGPTVLSAFIGQQFYSRDTVFINSQTKIKMDYADAESGPQKLTYTIDNNPTEMIYKEPITIDKTGFHKISIIGYDNVNNRNFRNISFVVDNVPPQIVTKYSVDAIGQFDGKPIYPPFVDVFVAPTDNLTGIYRIVYSVNNQPERDYNQRITGFIKGQKNIVKIRVIDNLMNESTLELQFYTLEK